MKKALTLIISSFLFVNLSPAQNALNFDGIDDHVITLNAGSQGNSPRTVEAWVKTSFVGSQSVIVDWGDMSLGHRFTLNMINGIPRIEIGGSGMNGFTNIADGNWHHLAAVYNPNASASNYLLYVDGQLDNSGPLATLINTSAVNPVILGRRNDGINYWQGEIDEVRIWNSSRTGMEIFNNYQIELCAAPNDLLYYYKCNQGIASGSNPGDSILIDQSIIGNNGSLINFALSGSSSNWVSGQNLGGGSSSSSITVSSCDSYTSPSGNYTWNSSGMYTDTIPNALGCDSIISIDLTINSGTSSNISPMSCGAYTAPSGALLTSSGVYTDTIPNSYGCDSIITINLSITYLDLSVIEAGLTLTSNQSTGTYQWMQCIGNTYQIINGATSQSFTGTWGDSFAVEISLNNCVDTSSCYITFLESLNASSNNGLLKVYPNPSKDFLVIHIEENGFYRGVLHIYDVYGHLKYKENLDEQITSLDISDYSNGVYFYEFTTKNQKSTGKFIKE